MERQILLDGEMVRYEFRRKKVKNLNLCIRADGSVMVSAGRAVSIETVEEFLQKKKDFLIGAIKKSVEQREREIRLKNGSQIPYLGDVLRAEFEKGTKFYAACEENRLRITLRSPESAEAREKALKRWKKEECRRIAESLLQKWYPKLQPFGVPLPMLRFREMTTRWGSCVPKKKAVTLNVRLLEMPEICMEYVLVHELVHFLQPDHSALFYRWMDRFLPDWRERRRLLR